jgi:drug/metabolite transporter (DMT)-like permease
VFLGSDPGKHQDLGRPNGSGAQNNFLGGSGFTNILAVFIIGYAATVATATFYVVKTTMRKRILDIRATFTTVYVVGW